MIIAIDIRNNELVSINDISAKDKLTIRGCFFKCRTCSDSQCVYVNRKNNNHFRHSKNGDKNCVERVEYIKINSDFNRNYIQYIKNLTSRLYIFDVNPLLISNIERPFIIKDKLLKINEIRNYENVITEKIYWLLNFFNRYAEEFIVDNNANIYIHFNPTFGARSRNLTSAYKFVGIYCPLFCGHNNIEINDPSLSIFDPDQ